MAPSNKYVAVLLTRICETEYVERIRFTVDLHLQDWSIPLAEAFYFWNIHRLLQKCYQTLCIGVHHQQFLLLIFFVRKATPLESPAL